MAVRETKFDQILDLLKRNGTQFIVIGGLAGMAHGNARATFDVDVIYARNRDNIHKLVEALKPFQPYLRGAPPGLPFSWDEKTVRMGLNFTLTTSIGDLDLFGEVVGVGNYDQLLPHTQTKKLFGADHLVASLERLVQMKRAAGRPKDFETIAELQALLDERRKRQKI